MPINFKELFRNTTISYTKDDSGKVNLKITTPRLTINTVTEEDIPFYQNELWGNPDVMKTFAEGKPRFYSGSPEEKAIKAQQKLPHDYAEWRILNWESSWINKAKQGNIWVGLTISLRENNEKIGHVVLGGGELAYFLIPSVWNKGYASEAAAALTRIALPELITKFNLTNGPESVVGTVRQDNLPSQGVIQNAGLILDQNTIDYKEFDGKIFARLNATIKTSELVTEYLKTKESIDRTLIFSPRKPHTQFSSSTPTSPNRLTSDEKHGKIASL